MYPANRALLLILLHGCGPADSGEADAGDAATTATGMQATTSGATDIPTTGATTGATTGSPHTTDATTSGTTAGTSDATTDGPACDPTFMPPVCDGDLLTGDTLKPHEVYIAGTLSEGACYLDAMSHWSTPDDAVGGFDCYFGGDYAQIRPSDGRLIYSMTFEGLLREFHCDSCPIDPMNYPNTPLNNDVILPTPMCDPEMTVQMQFVLTPEGEHYYRCDSFDADWYDAAGDVVYTSEVDPLLHVGHCGQALTEQSIVDLESGTKTPVDGLPLGDTLAIRVAPEGGFWIVKTYEQPELWHVALDGVATSLGVYPQLPADHTAGLGVLDGCGVFYQQASGPEVFVDLITQRTIGGTTEIVYTEVTDPLVKLHISNLITGA
jgi:hypothetical protein